MQCVCVCVSAMNDLLQTMAVSEGQWSSSTDHLEAPDEVIGAQHGKEFGSMDYAGMSLTRGRSARLRSDTGLCLLLDTGAHATELGV